MAQLPTFSENNPRRRAGILCLLLLGLLAVFAAAPSYAAVKFPALTGRVVDGADVLSGSTVDKLTEELKSLEDKTTNQLVVVTVPSLQGLTIEDYGVQLGRAWKIGQKGKDNGVLLIVAPKDHKVRIEVGYGLEDTITDAQSSGIIYGLILPAFRKGDMEQGIIDGTERLIELMGGNVAPDASASSADADDPEMDKIVAEILTTLMLGGIFYGLYCGVKQNFRGGASGGGGSGSGYSSGYSSGSSYSSSSSSDDSSSESYSGGGGSFGGGGSSGSW